MRCSHCGVSLGVIKVDEMTIEVCGHCGYMNVVQQPISPQEIIDIIFSPIHNIPEPLL